MSGSRPSGSRPNVSKKAAHGLLLAVVAVGVFGAVGCGSENGDPTGDATTSTVVDIEESVTTDRAAAPDNTAPDNTAPDNTAPDNTGGASADTSSSGLSDRQADDAIDIARAYFVAETDYTGDQFDWMLVAAAEDDDGQWWARVSATSKEDPSLEVEQIFVYSPAETDSWFALDMGTGVEPAADERFPEEVRESL